jgi:hypothetical protein
LPVLLQVLESIFFLLVLHLGDWAEYLFSRFLSPLASPCFGSESIGSFGFGSVLIIQSIQIRFFKS